MAAEKTHLVVGQRPVQLDLILLTLHTFQECVRVCVTRNRLDPSLQARDHNHTSHPSDQHLRDRYH